MGTFLLYLVAILAFCGLSVGYNARIAPSLCTTNCSKYHSNYKQSNL